MLQQYNHILVPVDGSYEAELAFKKAVAKVYDDNEKQFGALFKEFGYSK